MRISKQAFFYTVLLFGTSQAAVLPTPPPVSNNLDIAKLVITKLLEDTIAAREKQRL